MSNTLSYQSDAPSLQKDQDSEELHFKYTFKNRSYLLGSSKAVLYISCNDFDDMDVCTQIRKADKNGKTLWSYNVPLGDLAKMGMAKDQIPVVNPMIYLGPTGNLRASHRALDKELTKPHQASLARSRSSYRKTHKAWRGHQARDRAMACWDYLQ
jgi:uncharacterized protein